MSDNIKDRALDAMMLAITIVLTMAIRIPTPIGGHLNLGDCAVLLAAFLLGSVRGAVIGGIGSALADLLGGHSAFVAGTLVIKGLEGYIAGVLGYELNTGKKIGMRIIAAIAGSAIMVGGYYVYEIILLGKTAAALVVIPNTLQGAVCAVLAVVLYPTARKILKKH